MAGKECQSFLRCGQRYLKGRAWLEEKTKAPLGLEPGRLLIAASQVLELAPGKMPETCGSARVCFFV